MIPTPLSLPRAGTWLRQANPFNRGSALCTRHVVSTSPAQARQFATSSQRQQPKDKLDPPLIPDLTARPCMDLDNFLGQPGWKIDDLLPPSRKQSQHTPEISIDAASEDTSSPEITSETLRHLLHLSALPAPSSHAEQERLLSALHDQLHFVRHVQSVPTDDVTPLSRIGYEPRSGDTIGVLTYDECVEAAEKVAAWKPWNVTDLISGSRLGRESGYFAVVDKTTHSAGHGGKDGSVRRKAGE
jgi:hypothetical protein